MKRSLRLLDQGDNSAEGDDNTEGSDDVASTTKRVKHGTSRPSSVGGGSTVQSQFGAQGGGQPQGQSQGGIAPNISRGPPQMGGTQSSFPNPAMVVPGHLQQQQSLQTGMSGGQGTSSTLQQQQQQQQQQTPQQPLQSGSQPVMAASMQPPGQQMQVHPGQPGAFGGPAQQQVQTTIWTGTVDVMEQYAHSILQQQRGQRQVKRPMQCYISAKREHILEMHPESWPATLTMQAYPKQATSMIMSLMKLNQQQNMVRVVTFNFAEPPEQVYTLRLLMSSDQTQKHFGIVHFNNVTPQPIKALILVWNEKAMQFTGLIPLEQEKFVEVLKKVFKRRQPQPGQQLGMSGPQQPQMMGNQQVPQQPGVSTMPGQQQMDLGAAAQSNQPGASSDPSTLSSMSINPQMGAVGMQPQPTSAQQSKNSTQVEKLVYLLEHSSPKQQQQIFQKLPQLSQDMQQSLLRRVHALRLQKQQLPRQQQLHAMNQQQQQQQQPGGMLGGPIPDVMNQLGITGGMGQSPQQQQQQSQIARPPQPQQQGMPQAAQSNQPGASSDPSTLYSEEDTRLFKEAMLRGFIESALALLMLLGVTGSGKTEFKRIVLGQKVPKYSPSTPLAKAAVRSMSVCQLAANDIEWLEISHEKMLEMVASTIKKGLSLLEQRWQHSSHLAFTTSQSSSDEAAEKQEESPVPSDEIPAQPDPSEVKAKVEATSAIFNPKFLEALDGMKLDSDLIQAMNKSSTESVGKFMDVDFIYLLDSGGQPPFREMLPHFVQQASAIVLMQKLNERLDYRPTIRYREEGGREDKGYTSQLTNEQILYQYIQGVQSHKSKVFVVGTHQDKEGECKGETRKEKNQKLIDSFRPVLGNQMELYKAGKRDQLMFPLNCTSRKSHDKGIVKKLRKRVMEKCMGEKVKIPVQWFVLEQMLQLLADSMKESVLSIDECCEAAKQKLLMPRNVCEAALRYLGQLNIIFFRPDILPDVVFSSAQVVLDKLTELVRCNHALRTEESSEVDAEFTDETPKSKSSVEKSESEESEETSESEDSEESYETNTISVAIPSYIHGNGGQRFREYGLLDSELLEKAFPSHFRKDLFSSPEFLRLLEKLLIAGRLNNGEHFIPSLLPDLPVEKIGVYRATSDHPPPLVIHYPKMWLPVGVMSSLIVFLQNECKWEPFWTDNPKTCMYHNCYQFHLPSRSPGDMVLLNSIKFLELHVRPKYSLEWEERSDLFRLLSSHVMTGLFEAHKSLHYTPPEVELGFLCSGKCGNSEVHLAIAKRKFWSCSQNPDESGKLTEKQVQWLECAPLCCLSEVTGSKAKGSPSLDMKDIQDIQTELQPVKRRWKHIGLSLKLDLGQLKKIEIQHRDEDRCLTEMLSLWLNRNYNTERYGVPSAELLAEAVGDPAGGNDTSLAGNIIKKYTSLSCSFIPTLQIEESVSQSLQPSQSPTEIPVRKPTQPLISPLNSDDLFDVNSELKPVEARWKHIGLALRLDSDTLNVIEVDCVGCSGCLTKVLTLWLKKNYNYQRFGEPSWELLADAVKHPSGGSDTALAEEIRARHCNTSQSLH